MSNEQFPVQLGPTFRDAVKAYIGSIVPLTVASLATLGVYTVFRIPAQSLFEDGRVFASIGVDLIGLILAGSVAMPWYKFSLDAVDGKPIDMRIALIDLKLYLYQAVAGFWFWAGVLLGLRYLFGIPSIFVALLYAFHGFVIADGQARSGLLALGHSVRITEGRRLGLFAIAGLLLVFNLFGAIAVGFDINPLTIGLAVLGLAVTTSISMVFGAILYRAFTKDMKWPKPPTRRRK